MDNTTQSLAELEIEIWLSFILF